MLFLPRSVKIISELQRAHIASDNVWRIKRDVRHAKYNIIYGNKPDDAGNLCDYILGDTYKTHVGVSANQLTLLRSSLSLALCLSFIFNFTLLYNIIMLYFRISCLFILFWLVISAAAHAIVWRLVIFYSYGRLSVPSVLLSACESLSSGRLSYVN